MTARPLNYSVALAVAVVLIVVVVGHVHLCRVTGNTVCMIGDDGTSAELQSSTSSSSAGGLMKEAENIYALWCTGRTCCDGMLVTLKLLKRQDLVSSIARLLRPVSDQIVSKRPLFMCVNCRQSVSQAV